MLIYNRFWSVAIRLLSLQHAALHESESPVVQEADRSLEKTGPWYGPNGIAIPQYLVV